MVRPASPVRLALVAVLLAAGGLAACAGPPDETAGGCRVRLGNPVASADGRVVADTQWSCTRPADQIYGAAILWFCPAPRSDSPTEWSQHGCEERGSVGVNTKPPAGGAPAGSQVVDDGAPSRLSAGVWTVTATWGSYAPSEAPDDRQSSGPVRSGWVPLPPPSGATTATGATTPTTATAVSAATATPSATGG
jgi:hypothetical protein